MSPACAARSGGSKTTATKVGRKTAAKKGRKMKAGTIKIKDGDGNVWTGHGRRPQRLLDEISAGKTPEQLAA